MFYTSNLLNFLKSKKESIICYSIYIIIRLCILFTIFQSTKINPLIISLVVWVAIVQYFTFKRSNLMLAYIVDFLFIQYYKLTTSKNVTSSMTSKLQIWARNITYTYKIEKLEKEGSLLKPKLNSMLQLIKDMHKKFGISNDVQSRLSKEEKAFRVACLREEIEEFFQSENIEDEADALIDEIVFCLGSLERMGLLEKTERMFNEVMKANLSKEIGGATKKRDGKNSFSLDLVKHKNWKSPDLLSIINN